VYWSSLAAVLTYAFQPLSECVSLNATIDHLNCCAAGSIFQIRQAEQKDGEAMRHSLVLSLLTLNLVTTVTSIKNIGLNADSIADLNGFMAAAGYTDATAILNGVGDPPFVHDGWATAEVAVSFPTRYISLLSLNACLQFPANQFLNGTMSVNTAGIQTNANCSNPTATPVLTQVGNTNVVNLTSSSLEGCTHSVLIDPTVSSLFLLQNSGSQKLLRS
jgi:hypothetical protein